MKTHFVDAEGTALHVADTGGGAPLLLGHSLLCDGTMFGHLASDLARDYRVLNLDFRGHGRSGTPRADYTMIDQAEDLARVLDALDVERAVVVGLSMGAMAAMHLTLLQPERVAGLVLMNTSAAAEPPAKALQYRLMAAANHFGPLQPLLMRQVAPLMFGATFRREHPQVVQTWRERFESLDRRAVARAVHMVAGRPSIEERLHEIRTPTLVVGGAEDRATPPAYARRIAERIAGARLEVLPATGHLSTVEQPELTAQHIREFLGELKW